MTVTQLVIAAILACCTRVALVILHPFCTRTGLLDHPNERKQHGHAVPLAGGLALVLVTSPCAIAAAVLLGPTTLPHVWVILTTGLGLFVLGLLDDRYDLSVSVRLVGEIAAAAYVVYVGDFRVTSLGALGDLGVASGPFTVLCIVTFLNACNMVDGADGLLGSVLLPPLVALAALAPPPLNWEAGLPAAALAGFLMANWPRQGHERLTMRVFLGDGGVLFAALMTCLVLIRATQNQAFLSPGAVPLLVFIPLAEMATTVVRRIARRVAPTRADSGHLHHQLLARGWSAQRLATSYFVLSTLSTTVAVAAAVKGVDGLWLWAFGGSLLTAITLAAIFKPSWATVGARPLAPAVSPMARVPEAEDEGEAHREAA